MCEDYWKCCPCHPFGKFNDEINDEFNDDDIEDEFITSKDYSISARSQRRKPIIGEKSGGGKMINLVWNDVICRDVYKQVAGSRSYTKPSADTRNNVRVRKNYSIPGLWFSRQKFEGPENPNSIFQSPTVSYHHKKDDWPKNRKNLKKGMFSYSDAKNDTRRKSNKGSNKGSIKGSNKGMKNCIDINEY